MNVEVEHLPNCQVSLRVALPPERVETARQALFRRYQNRARIPGYRPGKAPHSIIAKKFQKEIEDELKRQLVEEGFQEAVKEKQIRALSLTEVDEVRLDLVEGLKFHAKAITAPAFELPEYQGIPVTLPGTEVTEAEIDQSLEELRERTADFQDIEDRPLAMDDFVVLDIRCTIEGQPVSEVSQAAGQSLDQREDLWLEMKEESFLPGFCPPLVGATQDEERTFEVAVATDFPDTLLAGKTLSVQAKVKGLKSRTLPELTDEWAATISGDASLANLREAIRGNLTTQKERQIGEARRRQILEYLHARVTCELPDTFVHRETQRIVEEIVRDNQMRGVADEELQTQEEQIVRNAAGAAENRLKTAFILTRIAEKEGIKVSSEEFNARIRAMAMRYEMPLEKMTKMLYQRNAFQAIEEELLVGKALEFLEAAATVQPSDNPPATT